MPKINIETIYSKLYYNRWKANICTIQSMVSQVHFHIFLWIQLLYNSALNTNPAESEKSKTLTPDFM